MTDRPREKELLAQCLVVAGHSRFFSHDLQRNGLLSRAIVREENLAHSAFSKALPNLVTVIDDRAGRQRGRAVPVTVRHPCLDATRGCPGESYSAQARSRRSK